MIIFGTRGTYLKQQSPALNCPNCNTTGSVRISFFARYFHIFWIPFFPTSKVGISQCSHCKQALYPKEMPQEFRLAYQESSKQAKRPITHFIGLFLIGLFIASVIFSVVRGNINKSEYAKNPMVGDVYKVRLADKSYTFFKIKDIKADTVTFSLYDYVAESSTVIDKAKRKYKNSFGSEELKVAKKEISDNVGSAKIYSIERD